MEKQPEMQIKADDLTLRGHYTNAMQVTHTKDEIVLDFFSLLPPQGQLVARVVTNPAHAKRMVAALTENLARYEQQFGSVEPTPAPEREFGFTANPAAGTPS